MSQAIPAFSDIAKSANDVSNTASLVLEIASTPSYIEAR